MASVIIEKTTFTPGGIIKFTLDFSNSPKELLDANNINIDFFKVDVERNNFAFGFGETPNFENLKLNIEKQLPENFREGLYLISGLRFIFGENGDKVLPIDITNPINLFFWVSQTESISKEELADKISELELKRHNYLHKEIQTLGVQEGKQGQQFKVLIFGVGCLLHSRQLMDGYIIYPLGHGYSYDHMLDSVNNFTEKLYNFHLSKSESIEMAFSSSTPLFAIDFQNILAFSHDDAVNHCSKFAENIFTILAYDRGQRPHSFATLVVDIKTNEIRQAFHFPGYRGNYISDFNPSSTANTVQRLLPKIESSPWVDLIMRIYADAKTENNLNYALLKYWQILEMIAKKYVTDNNATISKPGGSPIVDSNGQPITTKFALGKVYKYTFDSKIPSSFSQSEEDGKLCFETFKKISDNPNFDSDTKVVSLWETLSSLYEIRNATAHSGEFNIDVAMVGSDKARKAAELLSLKYGEFVSHVQSMLMLIVAKEINRA